MVVVESDTGGYEMMRCQYCHHRIYKVLPGVFVINQKAKRGYRKS
jgi:DNA-directed RNA polymerase subunit RPC12/RpoP